MSHKLPPKPSKPQPRPRPQIPAQPNTQAVPEIDNAAARLTDTFKRRRTGLYAVGVAVIVGAGAILGAQLKERQQVSARLTVREQPSQESSSVTGGEEKVHDSTVGILRGEEDSDEMMQRSTTAAPATSEARGMTYNDRQISFLEDRRGVLMKQRFDLERKLERVREKKKKEDEMEGRRNAGAGVQR